MYLMPGLPYSTRPILLHDQVVVRGIPLSLCRPLNCMEGILVARHWHGHDVELVVLQLQGSGELRHVSVFCQVPQSSARSFLRLP